MKAFVTGATGFVGSHVARVLAEQGADLRLLVRSSSDLRNIQGLKADRVVGDLRDPASIEKAMAGCDVVFHVAADYRLWVRDPDRCTGRMWKVRGRFWRRRGRISVRRVVYTSSVATMGFTSNGRPADEDSPVSLEGMIGHYKRSKFMAEQVALEAGRGGMDVVVVNPTHAGRRAGHQAHAHGTNCRGLPEKEVSRLRGYGLESGGRNGMRPRPRGRVGKREEAGSVTFWAERI